MVQARIVNEVKSVEVRAENQETSVGVRSESEDTRVGVKSNMHHDDLTGRNLPNQHTIESITGLAEALLEVSDKTFVFEQGVASDRWEIQHNLNKYPSVTLVDSANTQFVAQVEYIDENNCVVYMNGATKGKAYLN